MACNFGLFFNLWYLLVLVVAKIVAEDGGFVEPVAIEWASENITKECYTSSTFVDD